MSRATSSLMIFVAVSPGPSKVRTDIQREHSPKRILVAHLTIDARHAARCTDMGQIWASSCPVMQARALPEPNLSSEGPWTAVSKAIEDCHRAVHALGAPRVATDIRIGTRTDRQLVEGQGNLHKVQRVQEILANESKA